MQKKMSLENRFVILEEARQNMEKNHQASRSQIQTVASYLREREKYAKYYSPRLLSIGPIHHGHPKLTRGEQYKLMWASMYAEASPQTPQLLYKRIADNIAELRGLFSWDEIVLVRVQAHEDDVYINDENLAWMLFVDGCSVLQILEKAHRSKLEDLKVNIDILVLVQRDLFLLENQLPYQLLKLLSEDETKLKISMHGFCELQNMFTPLEAPYGLLLREPQLQIPMLDHSSPPAHLLDCLRTSIVSSGIDNDQVPNLTEEEALLTIRLALPHFAAEKHTTFRNIQELKSAAILVRRQKNVSLRNISFSSSFFGGKLHLPPLILNDLTVPTLLNLVAYEMCPDFKNRFEICSYVKLLDLLIDHPEDVKELRKADIFNNSLGSDKEVAKLFNTISSGLVHDPCLYVRIRAKMEKHYKNRLRIWMADACYTYFKSPWTIIAFLGALLALILTFLQTWLGFISK